MSETEQARIDELERDIDDLNVKLLRKEHALQVISNAAKALPPADTTFAGLLLAGCVDMARRALD